MTGGRVEATNPNTHIFTLNHTLHNKEMRNIFYSIPWDDFEWPKNRVSQWENLREYYNGGVYLMESIVVYITRLTLRPYTVSTWNRNWYHTKYRISIAFVTILPLINAFSFSRTVLAFSDCLCEMVWWRLWKFVHQLISINSIQR